MGVGPTPILKFWNVLLLQMVKEEGDTLQQFKADDCLVNLQRNRYK